MPRRPPRCDITLDDVTCGRCGDHMCKPRADRVVKFFAEILLHTKGRWARRPFILADWQEHDIIRPLFGTVRWDDEAKCYVRRYRVAWIELARKQGKSELLAGIMLYLLVADEEEAAEIYGCARDRDQARKVFDVALRMVQLSPVLRRRVIIRETNRRLVVERSASYYEVIAADAPGNLGHNPHGVALDEAITQPDGDLWNALRTAMGTRLQPLMVAVTTAGNDEHSFAKKMHDEYARIAEDPARAPHAFVYIRNAPADADPFDEQSWTWPNPALGDFLSIGSLRDEAIEARNEPSFENVFRQFRLNQWVSQQSRWLPMHLWDQCIGELWLNAQWGRSKLAGRQCFAGFDLAAKFDLTAWCLLFPPEGDDERAHMLWRFWLPESGAAQLDKLHDGRFTQWAKSGWLTITEGNVIDYDRVVADVQLDAREFTIARADCDEWSMWPIITRVGEACGLDHETGDLTAYRNTYERMSPGLDDVFALVRDGTLAHHGNPLARFCFESAEVRRAPYDPNLHRPSKPDRSSDRRRIDGVVTAAMAANALRVFATKPAVESPYEQHGLMVV